MAETYAHLTDREFLSAAERQASTPLEHAMVGRLLLLIEAAESIDDIEAQAEKDVDSALDAQSVAEGRLEEYLCWADDAPIPEDEGDEGYAKWLAERPK